MGSKKMVVYDDASHESVRVFDSGASIPDPETFGEYQLSYRTGDIVTPRIDATEPWSLELADFAAAIRDRRSPRSSTELGLDVVRTIEAVERSLAQGGIPVSVLAADATAGLGETLQARAGEVGREDTPAEEAVAPDRRASIGTAILGAGPAGLTAAHILGKRGLPGAVFEADGMVGGIAKTIEFNGYRFDLGGPASITTGSTSHIRLRPVMSSADLGCWSRPAARSRTWRRRAIGESRLRHSRSG